MLRAFDYDLSNLVRNAMNLEPIGTLVKYGAVIGRLVA